LASAGTGPRFLPGNAKRKTHPENPWQQKNKFAHHEQETKQKEITREIFPLDLDQAKPARLGEARNQKNSKSLVFLRRLMK
jgi:hypothetical protein